MSNDSTRATYRITEFDKCLEAGLNSFSQSIDRLLPRLGLVALDGEDLERRAMTELAATLNQEFDDNQSIAEYQAKRSLPFFAIGRASEYNSVSKPESELDVVAEGLKQDYLPILPDAVYGDAGYRLFIRKGHEEVFERKPVYRDEIHQIIGQLVAELGRVGGEAELEDLIPSLRSVLQEAIREHFEKAKKDVDVRITVPSLEESRGKRKSNETPIRMFMIRVDQYIGQPRLTYVIDKEWMEHIRSEYSRGVKHETALSDGKRIAMPSPLQFRRMVQEGFMTPNFRDEDEWVSSRVYRLRVPFVTQYKPQWHTSESGEKRRVFELEQYFFPKDCWLLHVPIVFEDEVVAVLACRIDSEETRSSKSDESPSKVLKELTTTIRRILNDLNMYITRMLKTTFHHGTVDRICDLVWSEIDSQKSRGLQEVITDVEVGTARIACRAVQAKSREAIFRSMGMTQAPGRRIFALLYQRMKTISKGNHQLLADYLKCPVEHVRKLFKFDEPPPDVQDQRAEEQS